MSFEEQITVTVGTQFTWFTGTKVQILTQKGMLDVVTIDTVEQRKLGLSKVGDSIYCNKWKW
jgi:hypothetical protein